MPNLSEGRGKESLQAWQQQWEATEPTHHRVVAGGSPQPMGTTVALDQPLIITSISNRMIKPDDLEHLLHLLKVLLRLLFREIITRNIRKRGLPR